MKLEGAPQLKHQFSFVLRLGGAELRIMQSTGTVEF